MKKINENINAKDNYRWWPRRIFNYYKAAVAYVEVKKSDGSHGIGTCFHIGEGIYVTARHVVDDCKILRIGADHIDTAFKLIENCTQDTSDRDKKTFMKVHSFILIRTWIFVVLN